DPPHRHALPTRRSSDLIKDWSSSPAQHEAHVRALHALGRPFSVLTTESAWLLSALVLGSDGLLSGSGSVIADLHAALFDAVQARSEEHTSELQSLAYLV